MSGRGRGLVVVVCRMQCAECRADYREGRSSGSGVKRVSVDRGGLVVCSRLQSLAVACRRWPWAISADVVIAFGRCDCHAPGRACDSFHDLISGQMAGRASIRGRCASQCR